MEISPILVLWGAWSSEWIKHKRTFTWPLVLLVPAIWVALVGWYLSVRQTVAWSDIFTWVFEAWTALFLPVGAALLAGLTASYEMQAGNWSALLARPAAPGLLYASKLLTLLAHALISTALAAAAAVVAGLVLGAPGSVPWRPLVLAVLLPWAAALPVLALQLWVATAKGLGASLGLGAVGLLLAAVIGGTSLGSGVWPFVPWAWPVRIMVVPGLQLLGKLPPGAAHPQADAYALFILTVGMGLGLLLAVAGILWFSRREVQGGTT